MNFQFTDEQQMIQQMARDFAGAKLAPIAAELDRTGRFPKEIIAEMADSGFMGINVPEAYGGADMDAVCKVLVVSELARKCASTAEVLAVHTMVSDILRKFGNEAQKKKYLTAAASGKIGAFALTEPGAGSDAASAKTKAVSDGDDYVINGTKCFISNMGPEEGDFVVLVALTDPGKGVKGMSAILVDRGTPGFSLGKTEDKMGIRAASVSELIFEDCRVPKANRLGAEGEGFKIAMIGLDGGRIGMAAQALGICDEAIAASASYMKQRVQFGRPIAALQGLQWYIADMATRTEAARALIMEAADLYDRGLPVSKLASMAKYFASENAVWVTNKALQIHGGYGYMKDYPIERMYRDARIIPLYEGTSEIQKLVIAREAMK
ncbi:acyl-CoA dehydrogenase [Caproiciproducens sp. NJN-50]|uniref:acyl-CoA dehydrogenase family protein n=1 Tax=Acutalibacteraceae TaxID=3082771 RepID=UPI000FFDFF7C|nr:MULTISPECIES: acyl-CoA dehydrogenase family protein [Acutalibacteraceae]QAT48972.1 acyl-CoA dehydrogenase [Caproiciproducens sp. NJN-50]